MLNAVVDCLEFSGEDGSKVAMPESVGEVFDCISKSGFIVNFGAISVTNG